MGWPSHPYSHYGVAPGPWGWFGHPKRLKKKKKKKRRKNGFGLLRVAGPPQMAWGGGFSHPIPAIGSGRSHTHALGGGPATPKSLNPFFLFFSFLFLFWPFGVVGPPLRAWGWLRPPHTGHRALGQKWGG
jgi:hypothetical protein